MWWLVLTSCSNRWVVGALDSAWRAVYSYLLYTVTDPGKLDVFYALWGKNAGTGKPNNISLFERYLASSHKAWLGKFLNISPRRRPGKICESPAITCESLDRKFSQILANASHVYLDT